MIDSINGHELDKYQKEIVLDNSKSLLVVAGAGSGKTLTIIGKVKYLIEKCHYKPSDILCISFTNETVNNLINKVGYKIDCYTFHKLAMEIIKDNNITKVVAKEDLLDFVANEYFHNIIYEYHYEKYVCEYLNNRFKNNYSYDEIKLLYKDELEAFINSIKTFIRTIKTNNHNIDNFREYVRKTRFNGRYKCYLIIVFHLYLIYMEELKSMNAIDFDDMIVLACDLVKNNKFKRKYKYIIIDEFQDTSLIRYQLIKELIKKTNANLMCVGDDYQSIYAFSGCTLDIFVNFNKYFKNSKIMYLKNTYRNSLEIIKISTKFIKKNHYQLKKKLQAKFCLTNPIKIINYTNSSYRYKFYLLLEYLYKHNMKNIMILGRYNNDINELMDEVKYKDMHLVYLTVHKAKGLECENVILINMSDKTMGFPSKLDNPKIYKKIFKNKEKYPYAEERRLFYVALTRTKKNIFIMSNKNKESLFIQEIRSKTIDLEL